MIVQCSWKTADDRPVADAVTWSGETESADLEDEVMVENCIMLEAPDKGDGAYPTVPACQLLFSCQPPNQISQISVLCESRVMEVYGHHGEYLKTIRNELLEEAEDMVVFRGDIVLERPLNLCSIKFACLRSPSEMWLYGIKVHTAKTSCDQQNQMTIPLAAVEQRLAEMGLVLSDKAEAFKQLVEKCQKSSVSNQLDISYIIATLQQSNLLRNKSSLENIHQLSGSLDSLAKNIEQRDSQNNVKEELPKLNAASGNKITSIFPSKMYLATSVSTSPVMFERSSGSTQTEEEYVNLEDKLKVHINEQITEMESKIWSKMNQRLQELENKVLCKLDELESFVKPQGVATS